MITEKQARTMLNHPLHDAQDHKIGKVDHLFVDDATGMPEWVSVRTGWFGSSESFVPIRDASVVDDHLQVPYLKDKVKAAPNVDVDSGGHLSEQEERRLYRHYGFTWGDTRQATGRRGEDRSARTGAGTAGARATGATGTTTAGTPAAGRSATGMTATGTGTPGAAGTGPGRGRGDDAMTRSEERMHVGVERYESGHARLHKYVVTEEEQVSVPLRHEEAHVEREPITEAKRDAAMSGEPIAEAEHDVVLHSERAVVTTETVPVERVRVVTEEHVDEQTVTGQVRKERIEADLPDGTSEKNPPR